MDIRILVLDDKLNTAGTEISQSLSFFVLDDNGPFILSRNSPTTVTLKGVDPPTTLTFTCNTSNNSAQVKRLLEQGSFAGEFDLVLLDDHWGETQSEKFAGQRLLLEAVFAHVKGRGGEEPLVCLWTQHWEEDYRTQSLAKILRQEPFWGKNKVRGLSKTNYAGLVLLIQDVIAVCELQEKNAELESRLAATEAKIAAHLSLLKSKEFKERVVAPDRFEKTAERVEPFLQWKNGTYESTREDLRAPFPTGLFFVGEDAVFIDTVSEGVAASLTNRWYSLSDEFKVSEIEDFGIGSAFATEVEALSEAVAKLYSHTNEDAIVVIRCDNFKWPASLQGDLENQHQFGEILRRHVLSAAQINAGRKPDDDNFVNRIAQALRDHQQDEAASMLETSDLFPFSGKILWLFARLTNTKTTKLLGPVEKFLRPTLRLSFSDSIGTRRRVLESYAKKRNCYFMPAALKLLVQKTRGQSFGRLIGESQWVGGSFLAEAERKSKIIASFLYKETEDAKRDEIKAVITEEIVEEVLAELGLDAADESSSSPEPSAEVTQAGSVGNAVTRQSANSEKRLRTMETRLDMYEKAAEEIMAENPIKLDKLRQAIADKLDLTPNRISQDGTTYENELRRLLHEPRNAGRWAFMRQVSTFEKLINVPIPEA